MPLLRNLLITFTLALVCHPLSAAPIPAPPGINASGYVLMEYDSGEILLEKNADTPLEPASLTKIMTAYLAFSELKSGRINVEDQVTVSEKAWRTGGSRMFIEVGKQISVEDLLHGLIIQSGNDAAVALAEYIGGNEDSFADMMNQQAKLIGMTNTHYVNATGLPAEGHTTTARDLALLSRAMIKNFPEYYPLHAIKEFEFNGIQQYNRNKLLWRDKTVDGIKTGHTEAAGYCLVASALRDSMRMISVVLGTSSENARAQASTKLLNYGFRFFEARDLYQAGETLTETRIWKGERQKIRLGVSDKLQVIIPRGSYDKLKAELEFSNRIIAPVTAGTPMGKVIVQLDGKTIAERPLIALETVNEGTLWIQAIDAIRLMAE